MSSPNVPSFSIKELFEAGHQYVIPVYQRNYAWGAGEVRQLLQDIYDYTDKSKQAEKADTPYYIGTLVVYERKEDDHIQYETIDGQQRLTTLTLLLSALHRWCHHSLQEPISFKSKLRFYSRPKSSNTLDTITMALHDSVNFINSFEYAPNIQKRYLDIENMLKEFFDGPNSTEVLAFYQYLTEKVHLLRVSVPEKTDLNHYFEIMNNRGEQLEKHEVLKAKLLSYFDTDEDGRESFNRIWEAVSDMERYVQYGFDPDERNLIFGEGMSNTPQWNYLQATGFENFKQIIGAAEDYSKSNAHTVSDIQSIVTYQGSFGQNRDHKEDAPERFNPVINFQGFLLHILRVQTRQDVPLDDKRLLDSFSTYLKTKEEVEAFAFNLLRGKHLFDQYVIKREFLSDKDHWSLKRLKWYEKNKVSYVNSFGDESNDQDETQIKVLMLQAMFHVTLPSMNYKHWLSAALNYLMHQQPGKIDGKAYADYLFSIAQSYFYSRILNPHRKEELDYFPMIFEDGYKKPTVAKENLAWNRLNQGTAVENFAFNFLDYLLWLKQERPSFDYSARSSVEHFYPQNPMDGGRRIDDPAILDSFGNLCLISSSKNSRLSNYLPSAKIDHYEGLKNDSLKLKTMMDITAKTGWDAETIQKHEAEMRKLFESHYPESHA